MDATHNDPMIRLEGVSKKYPDGTVAVHELDLDVAEGETVVLIGPSGCGKSTTLKMVNRLIEPTSGRIVLGGEDVTDVDPVRLRRRIGYVIQQVGLFPHQTVRANVATVPQLLGWDKRRVTARVDELLELVGLDPARFGSRYPHQLSGGQRQRVGVARALAVDPPVLLMDEPFGAVDPIVRDRLQGEFVRLQKEVRKTVLFVTHDIEEAVRIADRVAVFREGGFLEQYATPAEILADPANEFVADFVGGDRSVKRLSVTPLTTADLEPLGAAGSDWPRISLPSSLRDALSVVLDEPSEAVAVVLDRDGTEAGTISAEGIRRALHRHDPVPTGSAAGEPQDASASA